MLWHISYIFLDRVEFAQLRTSHKFRIPFSDAAGSIFRSSAVEANRAVPLDQRLAEAFTRSLYLKKKLFHRPLSCLHRKEGDVQNCDFFIYIYFETADICRQKRNLIRLDGILSCSSIGTLLRVLFVFLCSGCCKL